MNPEELSTEELTAVYEAYGIEVRPYQVAAMQQVSATIGARSQRAADSFRTLAEMLREPSWHEGKVEDMAGSRQVCPECREVAPVIISCSHANKIWVTSKWRAPKKTDDRAWRQIAEGQIFWDEGAVARKARLDAERRAQTEGLARKKGRSQRSAAVQFRVRGK